MIIFNGFHHEEYVSIVEGLIVEKNLSEAYIIYENIKANVPLSCRAHFFQCANLSHQATYDFEGVLPLDNKTIKMFQFIEVESLKMMERDEICKKWSYDKRKEYYLKHLRYWNNVVLCKKIEAFVTSNIPHVVYDYIIYQLCKFYKIKVICFYQFQPGISFCLEDYKNPIPNFNDLAEIELHSRLKMELEFHNSSDQYNPFYMQENETVNSKFFLVEWIDIGRLYRIFKAIGKIVSLLIGKNSLIQWLEDRLAIKKNSLHRERCYLEYKENIDKVDLNSSFYFFPLHLQPELSTSPMAGVFVDQYLIVEMISRNIPENTFLFIKEHPNQDFSKRDLRYYQRLKNLKNVKLLPLGTSSKLLIKHSKAVITCTGTAGWEALLTGKKVLLFGDTFYKYSRFVYRVNSEKELLFAVSQVEGAGDEGFMEENVKFLRKLSSAFLNVDIDPEYCPYSSVKMIESIKKVQEIITRKLD